GGGLLGGLHEGVGPLGGGGGEGVVGRVPALGLLVPLEHGEVGDPDERPPALGDEAALGGQAGPEVAEDELGRRGPGPGRRARRRGRTCPGASAARCRSPPPRPAPWPPGPWRGW